MLRTKRSRSAAAADRDTADASPRAAEVRSDRSGPQAFSMLRKIEIAQARDLVFQGVRVNAVSHDAHRRAFGARRAPPTHSGPWRSGLGRNAIAAGSRIGLLRY